MKLFHRHKWKYLGKEFHKRTIKKHEFFLIGYSGGRSNDEEHTINVTTIRFFCKRCSEIKTQTVDGTMKITEIAAIQGIDLNKDES